MNLEIASDDQLLDEVKRRFDQKNASLSELEFLTKKLYDLNEKLKETDVVKSEFLSLIKNVFNNPLSSLLNLSSMMLRNDDSPKTQGMKVLVDMELLKLNFQLNNIFTAAEIEAGEISSYWSEIHLDAMISDVLKAFKYVIDDKALSIRTQIDFDGMIVSDAKKLNCVLSNLISNACEYSFVGKSVVICAKKEGKALLIDVENCGDVILMEQKKEMFNRFKKVDKQTRARQSVEGLGLGLSIVNALVESLDGSIDYVSSEAKTVFSVKIALQDESKAESSQSDSNEFLFDDFDEMKEF